MDRCPVKRSEQRLMELGIATSRQLAEWRLAMNMEVVEAVERARSAPWPSVETLFDLV